jgi:hypothetical protein
MLNLKRISLLLIFFIIIIFIKNNLFKYEKFTFIPWNMGTRFYPTYDIRIYPLIYPWNYLLSFMKLMENIILIQNILIY